MDRETHLSSTGIVRYTIVHEGRKIRCENKRLEIWHEVEFDQDGYPHDALIYRLPVGDQLIEAIGPGYEVAEYRLVEKLNSLGWQDIKFVPSS